MKKRSFSIFCLFVVFFTMLTIQPAMAQENDGPEDFPDDVEDVPAAPINDYILVGVAAAGILGYRFIRKKSITT